MSLLLLGFLIGMRHALEADHVAAVALLATRSRSVTQAVRTGVFWGLGHTITLFLFGTVVILVDAVVPERLAQGLELAVALLLIGLGFDVIRRVLRDRIHYHVHAHEDGARHFHAHSHSGERHHESSHRHEHPDRFPLRALFVGLVHGMAGSAALILLTLSTVESMPKALLYMLLFGLGSVLGMAMFSLIIAIPLRYWARGLTWIHNGVQVALAIVTIALGVGLCYEVGIVEGLFA